jgi:hypothetical protein
VQITVTLKMPFGWEERSMKSLELASLGLVCPKAVQSPVSQLFNSPLAAEAA